LSDILAAFGVGSLDMITGGVHMFCWRVPLDTQAFIGLASQTAIRLNIVLLLVIQYGSTSLGAIQSIHGPWIETLIF
jgi:hypothetical protein